MRRWPDEKAWSCSAGVPATIVCHSSHWPRLFSQREMSAVLPHFSKMRSLTKFTHGGVWFSIWLLQL